MENRRFTQDSDATAVAGAAAAADVATAAVAGADAAVAADAATASATVADVPVAGAGAYFGRGIGSRADRAGSAHCRMGALALIAAMCAGPGTAFGSAPAPTGDADAAGQSAGTEPTGDADAAGQSAGSEAPLDPMEAATIEGAQRRTLTDRVRAHLEKTHGAEWARFDLLDVRWTNGAPPEGTTLGPISGAARPSVNGTVLLYADLERASDPPLRVPVTATVRPWVKMPVASRDLTRGALLTSDDVRIEERPLAELRGGTIAAAALRGDPHGLRARQALRAGAILTTVNVDVAPVIASGDKVTIHLSSGPIRLATLGIARRAGRPGEMIPVENVDSRKTLLAAVVDAHSVEVLP